MKDVVEFRGVSYWYPSMSEPALDSVSLNVRQGEFLLVAGSSGCGKSTLIRCFNGLVPHFTGGRLKGQVLVDGLDTRNYSTRNLAEKVGLVFQDPEDQFITSTIESEIAFGLENMSLPAEKIRERVDECLKLHGLAGLKDSRLTKLSGGEQQKTVLASVLAMKPRVLALDEPTSQLDPKSAREFMGILKKLNDEGMTIVLAEHRLERVVGYADRIFNLDDGTVGETRDMLSRLACKPPMADLAVRTGNRIPLGITDARKTFRQLKPRASKHEPSSKGKVIVRVNGLSKTLSGRKILTDITFSLHSHEFAALVGLNGSGKTTLVKHLNGLLTPDTGKVIVGGVDTRDAGVDELARIVGYVSQNPNEYLFSNTVRKELEFTLKNLKMAGDVDATLERLGILKYSGANPRDLSGGERQRVALASVLVAEPRVIVFDEPTRGMDHESKIRLVNILKALAADGKAILLVSHDVETVAEAADRVLVLDSGRLTADGPAGEVLKDNEYFTPQLGRVFPGKKLYTVGEVLANIK